MATCPTCRIRYPDDATNCPTDGAALLPDVAFASADQDLKAGDIVGEYRIEGKLGEGGFGAVFRAVHPLIGKWAAVKVLHREFSSKPEMVSRFIAEARAVNQIRHRNIIDIFSFGSLPDGRQYYVMELLDGVTFDGYLEKQGRLGPEEAIPLLRGIAKALDAAHKQGIAHRDLKPENIFLVIDSDGGVSPKLLDFGIAKLTQAESQVKTRTGTPMGTPYYMSPEQARGQNVDFRTDIYAFGVMCHQILTGKLPFDGESVMDIFVKHTMHPPPPMTSHNPELRPSLDAPVLRMLAKEPAGRQQSVGAALDELQVAARNAGYSVPPLPIPGAPGGSAGASRPSFTDVANRTTPGAMSSTKPKLTPDDAALVSAKTVQSDSPGALTGSGVTTAGLPAPASKRGVVVGLGVGFVGLAALAIGIATWQRGGTGDTNVRTAPSTTTSSVSAAPPVAAPPSPSVPPASPSADLLAAEPKPTSAPVPPPPTSQVNAAMPSSVAITVDSNVPNALVYNGAKALGTSPGPFSLPRSAAPVVLTVKAPGYKNALVNVDATAPKTVTATLEKLPEKGHPKTPNKDLENPF